MSIKHVLNKYEKSPEGRALARWLYENSSGSHRGHYPKFSFKEMGLQFGEFGSPVKSNCYFHAGLALEGLDKLGYKVVK